MCQEKKIRQHRRQTLGRDTEASCQHPAGLSSASVESRMESGWNDGGETGKPNCAGRAQIKAKHKILTGQITESTAERGEAWVAINHLPQLRGLRGNSSTATAAWHAGYNLQYSYWQAAVRGFWRLEISMWPFHVKYWGRCSGPTGMKGMKINMALGASVSLDYIWF